MFLARTTAGRRGCHDGRRVRRCSHPTSLDDHRGTHRRSRRCRGDRRNRGRRRRRSRRCRRRRRRRNRRCRLRLHPTKERGSNPERMGQVNKDLRGVRMGSHWKYGILPNQAAGHAHAVTAAVDARSTVRVCAMALWWVHVEGGRAFCVLRVERMPHAPPPTTHAPPVLLPSMPTATTPAGPVRTTPANSPSHPNTCNSPGAGGGKEVVGLVLSPVGMPDLPPRKPALKLPAIRTAGARPPA